MAAGAVATCVTLLVTMASLVITDFAYPTFQMQYGNINIGVRNLRCPTVDLGRLIVNITGDAAVIKIPDSGNTASCAIDAYFLGNSMGTLNIEVDIGQFDLDMRMINSEPCLASSSTINKCSGNINLKSLTSSSGNVIFNAALNLLRAIMTSQLTTVLCGVMVPMLQDGLTNHELIAPVTNTPFDPRVAQPLADTALIGAVLNIQHKLPVVMGGKVSLSTPQDHVLQVNITVEEPMNVSLKNLTIPKEMPFSFPQAWDNVGLAKTMFHMLNDTLSSFMEIDAEPLEKNGTIVQAYVPAGAIISLEIWFNQLYCTSQTVCTVSKTNGLTLHNLRAYKMGNMDALLTNYLASVVEKEVDNILSQGLQDTKGSNDQNADLINISSTPVRMMPETPDSIAILVVLIVAAIALMIFAVVRNKMYPQVGKFGPVPMLRVAVEDCAVIGLAFGGMILFALALKTSTGTLELGEALVMYNFVPWQSVIDMYNADLKALSVLIFIFNVFYPFFKFSAIVLFCVLLRKPDHFVFQVIDMFGKVSLLTLSVMALSVAGWVMEDVMVFNLHAPYYYQIVANVLSFVLGHYVIYLWRFGTGVRPPIKILSFVTKKFAHKRYNTVKRLFFHNVPEEADADHLSGTDTELSGAHCNGSGHHSDDSSLSQLSETSEHNEHKPTSDEQFAAVVTWFSWPVSFVTFALITAFVLVCWIIPVVRYHFSGAVTLMSGETKDTSLFYIAFNGNHNLFSALFLSALLAPILYGLFYEYAPFLASWCATDVFLIACAATLWQYKQFIIYIYGPDMAFAMGIEGELLWPLALLTAATVVQWVLMARQLAKVAVAQQNSDEDLERDHSGSMTFASFTTSYDSYGSPYSSDDETKKSSALSSKNASFSEVSKASVKTASYASEKLSKQ